MPDRRQLLQLIVLLFVLMLGNSFRKSPFIADPIAGSWHLKDAKGEQLLIVADNYFSHTYYSQERKKFDSTNGGPFSAGNGKLDLNIEFNSADKAQVGKQISRSYRVEGDRLVLESDGRSLSFSRVDNGTGPLAGNWQITGRMQGEKMSEMRPGARKTIKILSGKKFQWAAINTSTGEFFGTGGGSYTFTGGKYIENIEFFSRDSSRVGASLSFDGAVENSKWIHKGLSSKGEKIHEEWSRPSGSR
jgi:hypothetical protein